MVRCSRLAKERRKQKEGQVLLIAGDLAFTAKKESSYLLLLHVYMLILMIHILVMTMLLFLVILVLSSLVFRRVLAFDWGVWGRDCVRSDFGNDIEHARARLRCARCAVPLGLACIGAVWWQCHLAVSRGLVVGVSCGWRSSIVIGGEGVLWVAVYRCDWRVGCCVGSAVPLGLVGRASCGWRCAVAIGGEGVLWVALCRWDWRGGRSVGSAVPL